MGNGAILPFFMPNPEGAEETAAAHRNEQTVRQYYARIYGNGDVAALGSFVTDDIKIHRDHQVQKGIKVLYAQIIATLANCPDIRVEVETLVSSKEGVAYQVSVYYTNARGQRIRVRGTGLCRFEDGLINETWVSYLPREVITRP